MVAGPPEREVGRVGGSAVNAPTPTLLLPLRETTCRPTAAAPAAAAGAAPAGDGAAPLLDTTCRPTVALEGEASAALPPLRDTTCRPGCDAAAAEALAATPLPAGVPAAAALTDVERPSVRLAWAPVPEAAAVAAAIEKLLLRGWLPPLSRDGVEVVVGEASRPLLVGLLSGLFPPPKSSAARALGAAAGEGGAFEGCGLLSEALPRLPLLDSTVGRRGVPAALLLAPMRLGAAPMLPAAVLLPPVAPAPAMQSMGGVPWSASSRSYLPPSSATTGTQRRDARTSRRACLWSCGGRMRRRRARAGERSRSA